MVLIKDILLDLWASFVELVQFFAGNTAKAGITVDLPVLLFLMALIALWLLSGCWAASIASSRRHSAVLSFLAGMGVPFVYPLVILFVMDVKGARERERRLREAMAQEEAVEEEKRHLAELVGAPAPEAGAAADGQAAPGAPPPQVFNAEYFTRIARDEQGNYTGPWRVIFGGNEVKVLRILEPLEEVVSVEIEARDGRTAKFRIPYARITVCEPC